MHIEIPINPLSINDAHEGRHIKTKAFLLYEKHVSFLLPVCPVDPLEGELFIKHTFYLKNYGNSDTGNFEKLITDILVKRGYIKDDRYVKAFYLEKHRVSDKTKEKIITDIVLYDKRHDVL